MAETSRSPERLVRTLLDRHGRTYAGQAGITLRDTPSPLYRLLVLSHLLSARIRADIAVGSARELSRAGMRTPRRMADASWQERVDALGRGGYRRYDEKTATQLGEAAGLLLEEYRGDLRRLRADGSPETRLRELPGIGPTGTGIFLREVQAVWPELEPRIDGKALQGARRLGLPESAGALARLVREDPAEVARLAAALVRAALDASVADDVLDAAGEGR
ncbi:endonuclease [Streptomyces sp. HNM0574]|uniref:endonuclease n=1 Tax=Streptomyces sp. HNM0574 TaxID=2714954 RepID=UPI00146BE31B|nr:endonuclease [Streptomyces sp. HNM0574]NLU69312.1 endonuclease [Streptomyces sp. HNM0574]